MAGYCGNNARQLTLFVCYASSLCLLRKRERRPADYKSAALPVELCQHSITSTIACKRGRLLCYQLSFVSAWKSRVYSRKDQYCHQVAARLLYINMDIIHNATALKASWAHVAQLVEHFLGKEEVMDSSSIVGSTHGLSSTR